MIRIALNIFPYLGLLILPASIAFGQALPESDFLSQARSQAIFLYENAMTRQFGLYNGAEYNPYREVNNDHPYFESEYWEDGVITYYGERYDSVPMQYDLLNDLLVIEHYDQRGFVAEVLLHSEKVDSFHLLGHDFFHLAADTAGVLGLRSGFYDLLYDGEHKVFCKRRKMVKEQIESGEVRVNFLVRESYYLLKDGQVHTLKNKGSVLKALPDKKRALNQYVRSEVRDFRDKERLFVDLVRYYDSIE